MLPAIKRTHNLTWASQCYAAYRCYCDGKSIYQRDEEGKQPRKVYGEPYPEWRQPWIERSGEFRTKLSVFVITKPNPDFLGVMQKLPQFNTTVMKEWWKDIKELQEIETQRYISRRVEILGSNLAAIHYFTYRGAAVRLKYSDKWLKGDEKTLNLPDRYKKGFEVEAVDCSTFANDGLRYEGLENLQDLVHLKWLSLKNNKYVDVWFLDRIAGNNGHTLEYLDITGHTLTPGCIDALARMSNLRLLVITDPGDNEVIQTGLSLLEEDNPNLLIKTVDSTFETKASDVK